MCLNHSFLNNLLLFYLSIVQKCPKYKWQPNNQFVQKNIEIYNGKQSKLENTYQLIELSCKVYSANMNKSEGAVKSTHNKYYNRSNERC